MSALGRRISYKYISIVVIGLGVLFLHYYAPRFITEIKNPLIETFKSKHANTTALTYGSGGKYINFESYDSTPLSSYITYSTQDTVKGTVILLHGIRSQKECFIALSDTLAQWGYNAVALDLRAHGQSGGTHCTFGVKEKYDVSKLIDVLNSEAHISGNIGVWGQSLGGAVGLQATGLDKRIKFAVIESTFSNFETIVNDYSSFHLGFKSKMLTHYLVKRAGALANFNPGEAAPIAYCKRIEQPVLMVHGTLDKRIAIAYGKANFDALKSTNKTFLDIKGAHHLNVWKVGGEPYFKRVYEFLETALN